MNNTTESTERRIDAFIDEHLITEVLDEALNLIRARRTQMRAENDPNKQWPVHLVVIDSCQELWKGPRRRENGEKVNSIARIGRVANVRVLLRTETPTYIEYNGARHLTMQTIGDMALRDMIEAEADNPNAVVRFEVA